jgi:hypothetical protein
MMRAVSNPRCDDHSIPVVPENPYPSKYLTFLPFSTTLETVLCRVLRF